MKERGEKVNKPFGRFQRSLLWLMGTGSHSVEILQSAIVLQSEQSKPIKGSVSVDAALDLFHNNPEPVDEALGLLRARIGVI